MALVLDAYNATMRLLLGWAEPYLQAALTWLGSFISWRPTLYAHWRDAFVIVTLILTAEFRFHGFSRMWHRVVITPILVLMVCTLPVRTDVAVGMLIVLTGILVVVGTIITLLVLLVEHEWDREWGTFLTGFIGAFCFFAIDAGLKLLMP